MSAPEPREASPGMAMPEATTRRTPGSQRRSPAVGLEPFRRRLDDLDDEIARLLGERFQICREVALHKRVHRIAMMQPDRVAEVRARYLARGAEVLLPSDFTADLFELLIGATCRMEDELIGTPSTAPQGRETAGSERAGSEAAGSETVGSETAGSEL